MTVAAARDAAVGVGDQRLNLLRESDKNVYDKYEILTSLGQGSMVRSFRAIVPYNCSGSSLLGEASVSFRRLLTFLLLPIILG
jgi:hypothetical protein